jgi:1,4-alpha-glucan branching enzyme
VVHGKGSLLNKMPGPDWQKFANLRLLYSYLICQPGKKLTFMGLEVGQWNEWDCKGSVDWHLLQYPLHHGLFKMVKELNHFYLNHSSLFEIDFQWQGYEWVDFSDWKNSVISYLRKSQNEQLLCIHNFTPEYHEEYWIALPNVQKVIEIFNTDAEEFGGSNKLNSKIVPLPEGFLITLAPLATLIFKIN